MNDIAPKPAVSAASLPYIDRRSLSEAWFSALHLASDGPPAAGTPERRAACDAPNSPRRPAAPTERPVHGAVAGVAPLRVAVPPATPDGAGVGARRTPPARAARARRATLPARSYPPFRTSLTIGLERQRVQLLLRRDGATRHVVALCSGHVAAVVRRALACADAHLRERGETVRSAVHVVGPGGSAT